MSRIERLIQVHKEIVELTNKWNDATPQEKENIWFAIYFRFSNVLKERKYFLEQCDECNSDSESIKAFNDYATYWLKYWNE